jgi:hypothetical protein
MEKLIAVITLEEEEDRDLLACCMTEGTTDILSKRNMKHITYSTLTGRYLTDSEMKFREFFRVSRDMFHFILNEMKGDIITQERIQEIQN